MTPPCAVIAALQKGLVEARGMTFLDIRPEFTNPDGSYTDSIPTIPVTRQAARP